MYSHTTTTKRTAVRAWGWSVAIISVAILAMACGAATPAQPQPTPDYEALETRVQAMLDATYTAIAPPATATSTPEPTHTVTPEPTPTVPEATPTFAVVEPGWQIAYVRREAGGEPSIVLEGALPEDTLVLEHLSGMDSISDLAWSPDGEWLLFVSEHDALLSRSNERNLFMVRKDGSGLQMITGDHVAADKAAAPYVPLEGRIVGVEGACLVSAQGISSPVAAEEDGSFLILGVSLEATWARAVCSSEGRTLAGDVTLTATEGALQAIEIPVLEEGRGWKQAHWSRDGAIIAGTLYGWAPAEQVDADVETDSVDGEDQDQPEGSLLAISTPSAESPVDYRLWGRILAPTSGYEAELDRAVEGDLNGLSWSPTEDLVLGAVTGGEGGWLWLWDVTGESVGELFQMPNPDDQIITLANPAWSPDGTQVVFEVRRWYWWGEDKFRTDLMLLSTDGPSVEPLVTLDWGEHAIEPTWLGDGRKVVYQYSLLSPDQELSFVEDGSIWLVDVATGQQLPWTSGPRDFAPAANPLAGRAVTPMPNPTSQAS